MMVNIDTLIETPQMNLQDGIDLPDELHTNVDSRFGHGSTKLQPCQ